MIAIVVDDEPLALESLTRAVGASPDISAVFRFSGCEEALVWITENTCDLAFLDISMRGMGGLALAEKIMERRPACKIIFCTGYEEYALRALKLHVAGYLLKPISPEDVQAELDYIKGSHHCEKQLTAKCFGDFDVYAQGEKLVFKRSKTKELLAFLIDRKGAYVTAAQISVVLWENDNPIKNQNYLHQLTRDLRQALEAVGAGGVFRRVKHAYSVNPELLECDYYSFLRTGYPVFHGEYMSQYSWAEKTCGLLWRKA